MTARALTALICLIALMLPAASQAAPPKSAQRFADAALRLKIAVKELTPAARAGFDDIDVPMCRRALERAPRHAAERAAEFYGIVIVQPLLVAAPPLQQFVRDLEAIPTSDIALRQGRAAWRKGVQFFTSFPRVEKPCSVLDAWSRAGWSRAEAPQIPPELTKLLGDEVEEDTTAAKLERAGERLHQLGISYRAAARFEGYGLFDEIEAELNDAVVD